MNTPHPLSTSLLTLQYNTRRDSCSTCGGRPSLWRSRGCSISRATTLDLTLAWLDLARIHNNAMHHQKQEHEQEQEHEHEHEHEQQHEQEQEQETRPDHLRREGNQPSHVCHDRRYLSTLPPNLRGIVCTTYETPRVPAS